MSSNRHDKKSTVGFLLIIGEIIFNEQREEICLDLQRALQQIDFKKYQEINDLFNNLIHENEFHADCHYRQMANTENGSLVGFLYAPNFHTVSNVLKDLFNMCSNVSMIFCGQQIDSTGALILSDSTFTCENFQNLFENNPSYIVHDLQIILPLITNHWLQLTKNYLEKHLQNVQINDVSNNDIHEENFFGILFYERLFDIFNRNSIDFDIYKKLIPRDNSGTIAFDEPNLYVLYGQHGEASLFGIRGFVVLINGGFSRIPSYWNLIRGLQNLDACILTHFDYDTLPGLQTIIHRKLISFSQNEQLCKPDIGIIFLNHIQRRKLLEISSSKISMKQSQLLVNLNENIDLFYNDIKQLNIEIHDLVKHTKSKKNLIESINLYRKIAFGSLDFYVLHPTTSSIDDEKLIANLQKIPISNTQRSSSIIPLHHWYSTCSLLVWTPSSKTKNNRLVRILYTGVCPQTLIFEALKRVQHLHFLHDFQSQQQSTIRSNEMKISSVIKTNIETKQFIPQKQKQTPSIINRSIPSTIQIKTPKISSNSKPKTISSTIKIKSDEIRLPTLPKKVPLSTTKISSQSMSKDKMIDKSRRLPHLSQSKPKQMKKSLEKFKIFNDQKKKIDLYKGPKPRIEHREQLKTNHQKNLNIETKEKENFEQSINHSKEQLSETENNEEHNSNSHINEQNGVSYNDNDDDAEIAEKSEHEISIDDLDHNNKTSTDVDDDDLPQLESISMVNDIDQSLMKSNTSLPIDEIKSQLNPHDPMTNSFIDDDPNTENPYLEQINNTDDDDMEIIHHDVLTSNQHSPPSVEEINPQGLPIENHTSTSNRFSNKPSNRSNNSSTSMNNTYRLSSKSSSTLSDLIYYVDVAYIPNHGNEYYVNSEFFRRIRARYYILNTVQIHRHILQSLIIGKEQWEKTEQKPITLIPTYDDDELRKFFLNNKTILAELNINILPAAIRCNVQYDGENSPAQRITF